MTFGSPEQGGITSSASQCRQSVALRPAWSSCHEGGRPRPIGLAVAGVPFAEILAAVIFLLCVVRIGPAWVLVCAIVWLH